MSGIKSPYKVLIVDDEEALCWTLQRSLTKQGYFTQIASTAEAASTLLESTQFHVVLLDVRLPGMDGLTSLARWKKANPKQNIIIMSAYSDMETTIRAMQGGAFDFLAKPFDLDSVIKLVALAAQQYSQETIGQLSSDKQRKEFIGQSAALQEMFKQIALASLANCSILIFGESGTGKELVARAIHDNSKRASKPFIPLHVASLNPGMIESELFGHAKGAFTGAVESSSGLLALANGGTLFLDEIAEIPLETQVKLLRVLEYGDYTPVGSTQVQQLDVRIVAATHRSLEELVAKAAFREDLWYRLNVFSIRIPPLRDRMDDIETLAQHFLARSNYPNKHLSDPVLQLLRRQTFPGNVRELKNLLESACIMARGQPLSVEHFTISRPIVSRETGPDLRTLLERWLESQLTDEANEGKLYEQLTRLTDAAVLEAVLKKTKNNRQEASRLLGLDRTTVRRKIIECGIQLED